MPVVVNTLGTKSKDFEKIPGHPSCKWIHLHQLQKTTRLFWKHLWIPKVLIFNRPKPATNIWQAVQKNDKNNNKHIFYLLHLQPTFSAIISGKHSWYCTVYVFLELGYSTHEPLIWVRRIIFIFLHFDPLGALLNLARYLHCHWVPPRDRIQRN